MPVKTSLTSVQEIHTPAPFLTTGASNVGGIITTVNSVMAQISTVVYPPPQLPLVLDGLLSISALVKHSVCALLDNDDVKCWGRNDNGQLGDGTNTDKNSPPSSAITFPTGRTPVAISDSGAGIITPAPSLTTATCLVGEETHMGNSVMAQPPTVTRQSSQTPWAQDERPCM